MLSIVILLCLFVGGNCDNSADFGSEPDYVTVPESVEYDDTRATVRYEANGFKEVVKLSYFVDKTKLIHDFLRPSGFAFHVIAPMGFGCSTNMEMIKLFCERVVHVNGNIVPKQETTNHKLFTGKTSNGYLNIFKEKQFFNEHFGEYPVIYLDFRSVSVESFSNFIITFRMLINLEFRKHGYLVNSTVLSDKDKSDFNTYGEEGSILNVGAMQLEESLVILSRLLHLHFHKKCIVLIDDYDSPVYRTILYSGKDIISIMVFMNSVVTNLLRTKEFVYKALVNSRLRLSTVLSGLGNSVEHVSFMKKHRFTNYYGMTNTELAHLTTRLNISDQVSNLQLWYGGYRVFGTNQTINHMYSIVNYLTFRKYVIYWPELDLTKRLAKVCVLNDKVLQKIMKAVCIYNNTQVVAYSEFNEEHVITLRDMIGELKNFTISPYLTNLHLNFDIFSGYFTVKHEERLNNVTYYNASFPNRQMKVEMFSNFVDLDFFGIPVPNDTLLSGIDPRHMN